MENVEVQEMEKKFYVAAVEGNIDILEKVESDYECLLRKTNVNNNIIHIAAQHERYKFIACLAKFPIIDELICEKNSKGNTPLHVAAEVGNFDIVRLLCYHSGDKENRMPWRMQNSKGNTPLHVALVHDNVKIATFLLEKDPSLACMVNDSKEAPLHLAIKHHVNYSESESIMAKIKQPMREKIFVPGEDMSSVIAFLIEKESYVTCWPDANGSTPLHSAASISSPYNLQVVRTIIYHWPQSAEVCDASGKSILHLMINKMGNYEQGMNLLKLKEIYALRNCQDLHGNTPLHIAAMNFDVNMVRVLLESSTKLSIKNMAGVSVASLIQHHKLVEPNMTWEESEAADRGDITFLRERMSKFGNNFLLLRDPKGRNVLHKLMEIKDESNIMHEDFVDFIQQVLGNLPTLVSQADLNGDNPVHVLVRNHSYTKIHIHASISGNRGKLLSVLLESCIQSSIPESQEQKPWSLMQNAQGNTPLHEALLAHNKKLARRLLKHDPKSAGLVNKCEEAPIHLLARCPMTKGGVTGEEFQKEDIESMVNANKKATQWFDKGGLNPILRAFRAGNITMAVELCILSPEAAVTLDDNNLTIWHLLVNHPSSYIFKRLLKIEALRDLLIYGDSQLGNTPLHLLIENNRYDIVEDFFDIWKSAKGKNWLIKLLEISNKAGKTPADLIRESQNLPPNIEKNILLAKSEMIGVRSIWGIPTKEMQTYVNTLGIIAALLTTITFTAAFTVPGGITQEDGTPVLITKAAFQVFMISDILAMCLSMMVLICLLWIMATSSRHNSVMLLDFSVSLLLASFYATLLTFMAGLYVTTFPVKPRIAIVTLVMCSLLMVLVHKFLVMKLLIPFGKATQVFFTHVWQSAAALCTDITKFCKTTATTSACQGHNSCLKRSPNNV